MTLSTDIMNLQPPPKNFASKFTEGAYLFGYRDALNAAAELASKREAELVACLLWYVTHDTPNDSEYYEAGRQRAIAAIGGSEAMRKAIEEARG